MQKSAKSLENMANELLNEIGIDDFDQQVPNYIAQIASKMIQEKLLSSKALAESSGKDAISKMDVGTAAKLSEQEPIKIDEIYESVNCKPLQPISEKCGLLLPPENALTNTNYKLKSTKTGNYTVNVNIPYNYHQLQRNGHYKIPVQFLAPDANQRRCIEVIQIVDNNAQNQYVEYLKRVLLKRNYRQN